MFIFLSQLHLVNMSSNSENKISLAHFVLTYKSSSVAFIACFIGVTVMDMVVLLNR